MNSPSKVIGMLAFSYMEAAVDSANISIIPVTENQKQENCSIFICFDLFADSLSEGGSGNDSGYSVHMDKILAAILSHFSPQFLPVCNYI